MIRLHKTAALIIGLLVLGNVQAGVIGSKLQDVISTAGPSADIPVIITLADQIDVKAFKDKDKSLRRSKLIKALKAKSSKSLKNLRKFLKREVGIKDKDTVVLWNINALAVTVPADLVEVLAARADVEKLTLDDTVGIQAGSSTVTPSAHSTPEWNISAINAPDLWALGYDGTGTVIAVMDTGVDLDHPDIGSSWRGGSNSWFDPNNQHATPHDVHGHGTNVTGLIVGGEAGGSAIGTAPGAEWIAVKIFDDRGRARVSRIHQGFQWVLDPDGDPDVDDAPDVVNNSWTLNGVDACNSEFASDIALLKAAEIAVVFAGGNFGPNLFTSPSPANDPQSLSVGAVGESLNVASFSSRGPSACDGGVFPRISAPGANVYTADLTFGGVFPDSYMYVDGTSFSAPHVAASVALLKSAMDSHGWPVTVSLLESAMEESAWDLGAAGPDDHYGAGLLDVAAAYDWLVANAGSPQPGDLHFSAADYSVFEDAGSITVTVSRTGGSAGEVTVDYDGSGGTATSGADYALTPGTLTFPDGVTSQTFTVAILDDTKFEGDEDLNLTLDSASLGSPSVAVLTILEDDPPPAPNPPPEPDPEPVSIDITKAQYMTKRDKLDVLATSDLQAQAGLEVMVDLASGGSTTATMSWNSKKRRWQYSVKNFADQFGSRPTSVTVFGVEGAKSAPVTIK